MILTEITEILESLGNSIVVLKGISSSMFSSENKYFSFSLDKVDKIDIDVYKEIVVEEVISNREFRNGYKWMTMEEFELFKTSANINKMKIVMLENNLYYKQYPYEGTLSNIENIYYSLYQSEDAELDSNGSNLLEKISFFYGQINYSKSSGNYYVTYRENELKVETVLLYNEVEDVQINLQKMNSKIISQELLKRIELSDDELPFLDLSNDITTSETVAHVLLVISGDKESLPNNYLKRLNILKKNFNALIHFTTLSVKREVIENESTYKDILKRVYGYDNFREISFYKDIENRTKELIDISQSQIIDDIVNQAENALHGEPFRDIYITASTGAGKSVMFQIPALYMAEKYKDDKPLTLVISPLIGLMNDQVDTMKRKGVSSSATINGNTPQFEKERILEDVKSQIVDVLYLSPETLQARSDIKMLIGDRTIGVVIIDEAHIVTTWGKSFRADYWYLGIYLAKLRKEYRFPIVTFTATSIYGGKEDMYLDTRNSLNMISPISYFGNVRRNDILMCVRNSERELNSEGRDYRKTKNTLALKHLRYASKNDEKSLLYFPTVKLLTNFYNFILENDPKLADKTGKYYGDLPKEEKDEVLSEFKTGEIQFVLATKAFGMGIDIPDITSVYHYAPTGNVVDYIQEIGRSARNKELVPCGLGIIDYLPNDMNEVKRLHGMSAIQKTQILEVMRKVLDVYKEKGNNRNLVMSPEDFKYIFVQSKRDEDTLDNKVKTVLLMIEKDFSSPSKLGYSPFVARPRSLFGTDLIFVTKELESKFLKSRLSSFFAKEAEIVSKSYSGIYSVNLSGIWEKYYKHMTYPHFKYSLFSDDSDTLQHKSIFEEFIYTSGIEVTFTNNNNIDDVHSTYATLLSSFASFVDSHKMTGTYFSVKELGDHFSKTLNILDKFEVRGLAQSVINACFEFAKIKSIPFISEKVGSNVVEAKFIIRQDADIFTQFIMRSLKDATNPTNNYHKIDGNITSYYFRGNSNDLDSAISALGIGESKRILSYRVIGGNNPQIYLRINSIYPLEKALKQEKFYQNEILREVQNKHYTSVEMLKYLFTREKTEKDPKESIVNYSRWFWDRIEDYFMGVLPNEVTDKLAKEKK